MHKKRYITKIIKLFALIIIIKASFLVSFAMIGEDLGIDLYKHIDEGAAKLEDGQYSYELKGGNEGSTIADKINEILKSKGLGECEIKSDITQSDVVQISFGDKDDIEKSGNIQILSQKLDGKCSDKLGLIQIAIKEFSNDTKEKAKRKSEEIYNISKIGLYSDGSIENSPFDIIKDIKDIDSIVFTQEIEYEGEVGIGDDMLYDYLEGELQEFEDKLNDRLNGGGGGGGGDSNEDSDKEEDEKNEEKENAETSESGGSNNGDSENNTDVENINNKSKEENKVGDKSIILDNIEQSCSIFKDESGLSKADLDNILNNGNNNGDNNSNTDNSNLGENIDLGTYNRTGLDNNPFSFSTSNAGGLSSIGVEIGTHEYEKINDNEYWGGGCDTFFCITIEFITHEGNLLGGGKTQSIQSILERSNNHLKKFVNTSLIQSKMTTNNFELGLRDLKLPDIFSFGIVITKRTPPILNLQDFNDEANSKKTQEEKDKDKFFTQENLLRSRFDAIGMKLERENDLNIYLDRDGALKSLNNSTEVGAPIVGRHNTNRNESNEKIEKLNEYLDYTINSNYQAGDTDLLYEEFLELERFVSEIEDYTNNLTNISQGMLEIPIHE